AFPGPVVDLSSQMLWLQYPLCCSALGLFGSSKFDGGSLPSSWPCPASSEDPQGFPHCCPLQRLWSRMSHFRFSMSDSLESRGCVL
ncbi:hypothetical protein U1Q18_043673, partial [Sarracenia purpurea var. burkii]